MNEIKPITPQEAAESAGTSLPEYVILAINNLICQKYKKTQFYISQKDVMSAILDKAAKSQIQLTSGDVFDKGYLDFESLYEANGWIVNYIKPGYNESGPCLFQFINKNIKDE